MNIISDKKEIVFRSEHDGKVYYSIGMSKKRQDGSYENGYMNVHFKKDVELQNKTKILIKQAWLDFYTKNKQTVPYVFINEFETVSEQEDKKEKKEDSWGSPKDIEIEPDELPFY